MGNDNEAISSNKVVTSIDQPLLIDNSNHLSNATGNNSNHESSSTEASLTSVEERATSPADKASDSIAALCAGDVGERTFRIQIVAPGVEPFDLQVNSNEMVQELHQILLERESTCHRTCFSLQLDGVTLDHFTELKNVAGLQDGSELKVVEEPYTTREARIHIRHVRELIRSLDMADSVNGTDGASLSYLAGMTLGLPKKQLDKSLECSPPEYIVPGYKERPLLHLLPVIKDPVAAIKNMLISPYNPPSGNRKLKGDVLYLTVETREGRRHHITCCTKGFFVNATTDAEFRPTPSPSHKTIHHSLVDLLSSLSLSFKRSLALILKKRSEKHIFERLPTPYQVNSWTAPCFEQTEDGIRAEDSTQPHKVGLEDHIPGQTRDWNEELQTTRELPRGTLTERLIRERAIFKIHSDFVFAAIKGAMAVVDGNVIAINPADEPRTHMYIWNNIFFSLGFDVKDHYKDLGGDAAAHAATSNDLQGVHAYTQLDCAKLFTLGMVIVDYKGFRVTAQSIIPGILEREQEQSVVYGSIDFGKTVISSETYHDLLKKPAEQLKILPHEVYSGKEDGKIVKLYSSFETKGIIGNDSRHYILDLLRTFPPDINYLEGAEVTDVCKANGYPRSFPHKLASLRQELIDAFTEYRYLMFIRIAAYHVQQTRLGLLAPDVADSAEHDTEKTEELNVKVDDRATLKDEDVIKSEVVSKEKIDSVTLPEIESMKKIVEESVENEDKKDYNSLEKEISEQVMAKAAKAVGSIRDDAFDIRFNPDCYCTTVMHADNENIVKQKQLVAEACEFMLTQQIPSFVHDCLQRTMLPLDGASLKEAMHSRGINIRYLGKLIKCIQNVDRLNYLKIICLTELLCRSAKHVFRTYLQPVPAAHTAAAVSHFLNCLLTSSEPPASLSDEGSAQINGMKKSKSSRRRKHMPASGKENDIWPNFSSQTLWENIRMDSDYYYAFLIEENNIDVFVTTFGIQKTSILRRFAQTTGIQILLRDYNLESVKKNQPFTADDMQNLHCVVKHVDPKAMDAQNLFISGQSKVQQGAIRGGYEQVAEALNLMNNVYGAMHCDMAQCMRSLARLSYILGDPAEALSQQHKATLMSERCNGLDSANTVIEYLNLAHFSFANLHIAASLKLLYRARYLLLLMHGENHPLMAEIDGNIGVVLYAIEEYDEALKFLHNSLKLNQIYSESYALKTAIIYHLLAQTYSSRSDYRTALQMEKETFTIYAKTFGEDHEKTKESSKYLKKLTQKAVAFQKQIYEANQNGANSIGQFKFMAIEVHRPSLQSVLEVLNILNGIIFVQLKGASSSSDEKDENNVVKGATENEAKQNGCAITESQNCNEDQETAKNAQGMTEEALD